MVDTAVENLKSGLHFGHDDMSVDAQTLPLLPVLRRINALGMLTVESQPGERTRAKWGETEQRGYVTAFLPRHRLLELLTQLREMQSGCMVLVYDVGSAPEVHLPLGVASLDAVHECCGNLWDPDRPNRIMLTRERGRGLSDSGQLNPQGPNDHVWGCSTAINLNLRGRFEDELGQLHTNTRLSVGAYCVLVTVIRLPMCVPDIMDIVLSALEGMAEVRAVRRERLANL